MLSLDCVHMFKEGCSYWVLSSEDFGPEATADTQAEIIKEYKRLLQDDKENGMHRKYYIEQEYCDKVTVVKF